MRSDPHNVRPADQRQTLGDRFHQEHAECLRKANIELTLRFGNQMRIAVSVFNNAEDVDRLLQALA